MLINMYREVSSQYEEVSCFQCLNCKNNFYSEYDSQIVFCSSCGIKLDKLFTKRNKRWYGFSWKQHYPVIEFERFTIQSQTLDNYSFSVNKAVVITQKWIPACQIAWGVYCNKEFPKS